jgi:hypothetical protein
MRERHACSWPPVRYYQAAFSYVVPYGTSGLRLAVKRCRLLRVTRPVLRVLSSRAATADFRASSVSERSWSLM